MIKYVLKGDIVTLALDTRGARAGTTFKVELRATQLNGKDKDNVVRHVQILKILNPIKLGKK